MKRKHCFATDHRKRSSGGVRTRSQVRNQLLELQGSTAYFGCGVVLSDDLFLQVLDYFEAFELLKVLALVCRHWSKMVISPNLKCWQDWDTEPWGKKTDRKGSIQQHYASFDYMKVLCRPQFKFLKRIYFTYTTGDLKTLSCSNIQMVCPHIEDIVFKQEYGFIYGSSEERLKNYFRDRPLARLKDVSLQQVEVPVIFHIANQCGTYLERLQLNVMDESAFTDDDLELLSKLCPNVKDFSCRSDGEFNLCISEKGLQKFFEGCKELKELELRNVDASILSKEAFEKMDKVAKRQLKAVSISFADEYNEIMDVYHMCPECEQRGRA